MKFEPKKFGVDALVKAWAKGELRRNPEYQRGEAWKLPQKQALIDSIFRGYPIPPIFLEKKVTESELVDSPSTIFEIVDGQQRLVALRDFLDGKFNLLLTNDRKLRLPRSLRSFNAPWAGHSVSTLPSSLLTAFKSTQLDTFIISDVAHPDETRDIFIRLQSGTALTRQQIRDAWPGEMGPFVEQLAGKLDRRPRFELFRLVEGRSARSDEDDPTDAYVKHRLTCAQLITIFLGRERDPSATPNVNANDLDGLYHDYTIVESDLRNRIEGILRQIDHVFGGLPRSESGKPYKPSKFELFALGMFLQDVSRNPLFRLSDSAVHVLRESLIRPFNVGRTTSGVKIKEYYDDWRSKLPGDVGIRLDPRRGFSPDQKREIWKVHDGRCAVCGKEVQLGSEEYDHWPVPYRDGGKTEVENGRLVHMECHPRGRPMNSSD